MAKIADSIRLDAAELDELLRTETRLRIATLGPGSGINLTPMTFGWARGKVYIFGRGQKVANLRRNSTATVLVDTGEQWRSLRGVMLRGAATVLEDSRAEADDPHLDEARLNLGEKHNLRKNGVLLPYTATASGKSRRWIVFTPEQIVSWDNAKLP